MPTFTNTDGQSRIWPSIIHEGKTLELEAKEIVELDLPNDFEDVWLKLKGTKAKPKSDDTSTTDTSTTTDVATVTPEPTS